MNRRRLVVIKAVLALALVWAVVWGIRTWAGSRKITAQRVNEAIVAADLEDWSGGKGQSDDPGKREEEIRRIASMINRLDFREREANRRNRAGEEFFRKLSPEERLLFVDLTVMESMNRFMDALDGLPPAERRRFVSQALKEIEDGRTAEEIARVNALGDNLLERISEEGMRAYFSKASADTKLDLAPLMESMNELMQGMRGNELQGLGGGRR